MTGICDTLISEGIQQDCDNPIVKGMEPDGVIMNRSDIDFAKAVFDTENKNIIKTLLMKSTKQAYPVVQTGNTPFTGTKTTMVAGKYHNTFTNEIPIAVLDSGPGVSMNVIDGLVNGTFVLILRNKHKGVLGNGEYQIFGWYQGLHASAIENDKYSEDTDGGWLVTLQETSSPKSALYYFNTDAKTTETQYGTLTTPAE